MKRLKLATALIALFTAFPFAGPARDWQTQAALEISKSGLMEATLPAELHQQMEDGLDLKVIGPDGKSRAFELYWRENKSQTVIRLSEKSARLENNVFIWETAIAENDRLLVKSLKINVLSSRYIGKVDIFGLKAGQWRNLTRQAALYSSEGGTRGDIKIEADIYEGFRLEFTAYAKKPLPLGEILAFGEQPGKDFVEHTLDLVCQRSDQLDANHKPVTQLSATLPGSGLYIRDIELLTSAQFNGAWSVERQEVQGGQKTFLSELTGSVAGVEKGAPALKIKLDRAWNTKLLHLRLTGTDDALSDIQRLSARIHLPRLVFWADTPGVYYVRTGLNNKVSILEHPSAKRSEKTVSVSFGPPAVNANRPEENLNRRYPLEGAPFKADGYSWRSAVKLSGPGYYRIILHQKASLEENLQSLRIVRKGLQQPYFMEKGETKTCELAIKESYDSSGNTTTWYLEFPQASSRWTNLILHSSGIFSRTLKVERDQPKPVQGVLWRTLSWSHSSPDSSELVISLTGFPRQENKIRLVMAHGDNKPLKLEKARLQYEAPALHFLADAAEGYELYGGNDSVQAPSYDMDLIKDQLNRREPRTAELSEPQMLGQSAVKNALANFFAKNNWGLYAVLGFLSVCLIAIIVFVFPKPKNK